MNSSTGIGVSGRHLRYEVLLFATLGFEVVYIALLSYTLGRETMGGAMGWSPLFLTGGAMLFWNRLLLWLGRWEEGRGRLLSFLGALVPISFLMAVASPDSGGPLAGPGTWLDALRGIIRLFSGEVPATVALVVGLLLWFRSVLLAQSPTTLETTSSRFRWSAVLVVLLLVEAASRAISPPSGLIFFFFGSALIAFSLARAHNLTQLLEDNVISLPFNRRWFGTLLAGALGTMLLSVFVTLPFSLRGARLLYDISAPLRYAVGWILAALIYLLSFLILPIFEFFVRNSEPLELPTPPSPLPAPTPQPGEALEGPGRLIVDVILYLALFTLVAIILIYLYRLLVEEQRRRRETASDLAATFEQVEVEWDASNWWRRAMGALRGRGRGRPQFGVETVRDLYRNLLLFGDEHGLPRPEEDTPYEYLEPLCEQYPERREDFHSLTRAYVAARYGARDFSRDEVATLQAAWQRIDSESEEASTP